MNDRLRGRITTGVLLAVVLALSARCTAATATSNTPAEDDAAVESALFTVRVTGGYGGGEYPSGTEVHVFADLNPMTDVFLGWSGDPALLARPNEWHSTFTMPEAEVALTANFEVRNNPLIAERFRGAPGSIKKDLLFSIPPEPVGLILLNHGTSGSANIIQREEAAYFRLLALERGYGVVAFEAEESEFGDLNGDGMRRWDVSHTPDNRDLRNVSALVEDLRRRSLIEASTPLFAVGMSNGGVFSISLGSLAATRVSSDFPELRFGAVVSYCAPGAGVFAAVTETPTAWLMCGQDTNPAVVASGGSVRAQELSNVLAARGIATLFDAHGPSPLYPERLARVEEISRKISVTLVTAFTEAGFLDQEGFVTTEPDLFLIDINRGGRIAAWDALTVSAKLGIRSQIRSAYADHQFFSDWASRTLDFLDEHGS